MPVTLLRGNPEAEAVLAALGYGVGVTVNALEAWHAVRAGFDPVETLAPWLVTYELGRVPLTLGHAALCLLVWKSGLLRAVLARLAATGRMVPALMAASTGW